MKVKELIEILKSYDSEMKCVFTWESIVRNFEEENIYHGNENYLLFDADNNFYKKLYENNFSNDLIRDCYWITNDSSA